MKHTVTRHLLRAPANLHFEESIWYTVYLYDRLITYSCYKGFYIMQG